MTAERVLTRRQLNRAVLARQLLLARESLPLPRALERVGGIQAQYAPSMYIGLWSRLEGFERPQLTRALERRSVVQATLMRATIHAVSRADLWPMAIAVAAERRRWFLRSRRDGPSEARMQEAAALTRDRLAGGPVRRAELDELVGKDRSAYVGLWIDLVRAPPSGTWEQRRADLLALADDWVQRPELDEADAVEHLVRRYLRAFGPAAPGDVATWCGLPARTVVPALERVATRRLRDEAGEVLVDLPRAPLPDPDTPAPVRFLPTWDASLLVHARRTGILPEEHRTKIFSSRNPHSLPTFLVDGAVAGTWRHEGGRIELSPFARLDRTTQRELRDEADGLAELHT